MIIKYTTINEHAKDTQDCTLHVVSGVQEVQYGYYRDQKAMTKEDAEMLSLSNKRPDGFITYYKTPMNEGCPANVITLSGATEAFLMNDEGKTIERIR